MESHNSVHTPGMCCTGAVHHQHSHPFVNCYCLLRCCCVLQLEPTREPRESTRYLHNQS
ncbi:hypothetical protein K440DRAFT_396599 [Wilcoxina mikolae CBS 423.85]|nr:hypothetical protein K440DRAFT_396599 [Wilcoxina mikolae CBS 423.85]